MRLLLNKLNRNKKDIQSFSNEETLIEESLKAAAFPARWHAGLGTCILNNNGH